MYCNATIIAYKFYQHQQFKGGSRHVKIMHEKSEAELLFIFEIHLVQNVVLHNSAFSVVYIVELYLLQSDNCLMVYFTTLLICLSWVIWLTDSNRSFEENMKSKTEF